MNLTLNEKLNEAIQMAEDTLVKFDDLKFEDCFPYKSYNTLKDDKGREYKVITKIELINR